MEDFNIAYQKYNKEFLLSRWYYKLFKYFEENNIVDILKIMNYEEIEKITTHRDVNNEEKYRLDYIWITSNLLKRTLNSKVIDIIHFSTDHKAISLSMEKSKIFKIKEKMLNKQELEDILTERIKFFYDKMDEEKWNEYLEETENRAIILDFLIEDDFYFSVDEEWRIIKENLWDAANNCIINKTIKGEENEK